MNDKILASIVWVIGVALLATLIYALDDLVRWVFRRALAILQRVAHPNRDPRCVSR
jgi:hypothetical protein